MGRSGKEKMSHVKAVEQLHYIFHADRPVIEQNNLDVSSIVPLLHQEIFELNGHPDDGMTLEDYRAQEISDIQFFVYSLMEAIGTKPHQSHIDRFLKENNLVRPRKSKLKPDHDYEPEYTRIKYLLRDAADSLYEDEAHTTLIAREKIGPIAQNILSLAVALHVVLERNSTEEMRDKGARNMLKHSIPGYDNPANDYKTVAKSKGVRWKAEAKIPGGGNPGFFDRQWGYYAGPKIAYSELTPLTVDSALQEAAELTGQRYEDVPSVPEEWAQGNVSAQAVIEYILHNFSSSRQMTVAQETSEALR